MENWKFDPLDTWYSQYNIQYILHCSYGVYLQLHVFIWRMLETIHIHNQWWLNRKPFALWHLFSQDKILDGILEISFEIATILLRKLCRRTNKQKSYTFVII